MPIVFTVLLIAVIILCSIALVFIINYNNITKALLKINDAEISIDEDLRNMYDLIIKAINIIEKSTKVESKVLSEVKEIKSDEYTNFEINRILNAAYIEVLKISGDYEKINNNKIFKGVLNKLKELEEKLIALRTFYNKYTYEYNILLRTFPSNLVGFLGGYKTKKQYDGKDLNDEEERDFKI